MSKKPSGRDSRAEPGAPTDHLRVDRVYPARPAKLSAVGTTAPENEPDEKRQLEAAIDEIRRLRQQLDEVTAGFDRQRAEWKDELIVLQERHALEIAVLEEANRELEARLEVAAQALVAESRTDTVDDT